MHRFCFAGLCQLALMALVQPMAAQITAQPAPAVRQTPAFNPTYSGFTPAPPITPVLRTSPTPASALQSPEANTIRGWHRDYLGRDVGLDLVSLVSLLRGGMSPIDLQATILGSDEFYYQKGRDPQTFVRETLQAVTWSEPSYADVQRWTTRLAQLRNDRFALAREILLETQSPPSQTQAWREVAARLPSAARLAIDTIQFEIPGTPQGRQANLQAAALFDAVHRLDQLPETARTQDALAALASADRSFTALQTTLSNPPGTAPSAASIVRRIGTMLADTRTAISPAPPTPRPSYPPPGNSLPPDPATGTWQFVDQVSAARRAADSLIQVLSSQAYQDYTYNIVLRDLDTLASRLAGLENLARTNPSRDRLALEVQSLTDSSQRVQSQLAGSRLPYAARLYWESLQSNLTQLRETTGAAAGSTVSLRPSPWHESLLPLLDQAAAQLDVFLAGTTPLVYRLAEVPSVQADARSLRTRVMLLREQAGYGQPANLLRQTLQSMVGDYTAAFERWNRLVAANRLTNPARLSPVGETLNRVEQIINDALANPGSSAGSGSAAGLQLTQLKSELAESQRALEGLVGYREHPAIALYLEQLTGYVQQLEDATSRSSPADARRLAVGMQSVIGHLQSEATTLERRATGTWQQQATHLRFHAERIGRLVDEVEALLY